MSDQLVDKSSTLLIQRHDTLKTILESKAIELFKVQSNLKKS